MTESERGGRHRLQDDPSIHRSPSRRETVTVAAAVATVVCFGLVLSAIGVGQGPPSSTASPESLSTVPGIDWVATVGPTVTQPPPLARELPGDVRGLVAGAEFVPGLWITEGGNGCVYSRNRGASWETGGSPDKGVVVSLQLGATFDAMKCQKWSLYREY